MRTKTAMQKLDFFWRPWRLGGLKSFGILSLLIHLSGLASAQPVVTIFPPPHPPVTEAESSVSFQARRTGSTATALTAQMKITGTATNGQDYELVSSVFSFPAKSNTAIIEVRLKNDSTGEGNETIQLRIVPPSIGNSYVVGSPDAASFTILDDEPVVSLKLDSGADAPTESDSRSIIFHLSRTGPTGAALQVRCAISGTATNGVDYNSIGSTISFGVNEATTGVGVVPKDDTVRDPDETVIVTLLPADGYRVDDSKSAKVTIVDNDITPTITLSSLDSNANETGPDPAVLKVTRNGDLQSPVAVTYTVNPRANFTAQGQPATNGVDFQNLSGSITISPGSDSANITVTPINDTTSEGTEFVAIRLNPGFGTYNLEADQTQTVLILDNDLPRVSTILVDGDASENGQDPGVFRIVRTGATTTELRVFLNTIGIGFNRANQNEDYLLPAGILDSAEIPAGETFVLVTVTPVDDSISEQSETAIINLVDNAAYEISQPNSSVGILIADND